MDRRLFVSVRENRERHVRENRDIPRAGRGEAANGGAAGRSGRGQGETLTGRFAGGTKGGCPRRVSGKRVQTKPQTLSGLKGRLKPKTRKCFRFGLKEGVNLFQSPFKQNLKSCGASEKDL